MSCQPSNSELVTVPCDFVASQGWLDFFTIICAVSALAVIVIGIVFVVRTKSPLPLWMLITGAMCTLVEPIGDVVGGIYIPAEAPARLFTLLHRPIPLGAMCVWITLGAAWYGAYYLMQRGASVRRLVSIAVTIGVAELAVEIGMAQTGAWLYYSNHAMFLGVPVSTIAQNIGITVVGGAALVMLMPHIHGARWLMFPFFGPGIMLAYAFGTTWPGYLAIHSDATPLWGWVAGLLSAALNLLVAYAALYIEPVVRLRNSAQNTATPAQQISQGSIA
ncbi:Uncharacterised protein [Mycobacteroides abscessus subsp. abscessus]|nr:Uncharacterised protein [Mycobacteroides abscessus subsp. abscessus]